jgi:tripartite-type tricarboxylate transporter receptor subunit TctC
MTRTIGLAAAFLLGLAAIPAMAQATYPDKPIRILVGFSAGVAPDVTARLFGDKFNESWAKGVVVENVTGAGGNLALAQTAKAAPDGYTLVMGGNAALVINPNLMKLGYDPLKDFAYITQVFIVPNLVVVRPDFPAKTMPELIALAKAQPDLLVAGHAGVGTSQHLGGEKFKA